MPCQDTPSVKSSYEANVRVPKGLVAVMSAVQNGNPETSTDAEGKEWTVWKWKLETPIPAYLIALAVGNLSSRELSPRSKVWTEPETLDAAAWEFGDGVVERFLKVGEDLGGEYRWGRYDLLVLRGLTSGR